MNTPQDQAELLRALKGFGFKGRLINYFILLIELNLKWFGLKSTQRLLTFFSGKNPVVSSQDQIPVTDYYITYFNARDVNKTLYGRCLSRSLAMRFLLLKKGIETELKMGISVHSGKMEAHAWLEKNGQVLNDHPSVVKQYTPLSAQAVNPNLKFS